MSELGSFFLCRNEEISLKGGVRNQLFPLIKKPLYLIFYPLFMNLLIT